MRLTERLLPLAPILNAFGDFVHAVFHAAGQRLDSVALPNIRIVLWQSVPSLRYICLFGLEIADGSLAGLTAASVPVVLLIVCPTPRPAAPTTPPTVRETPPTAAPTWER